LNTQKARIQMAVGRLHYLSMNSISPWTSYRVYIRKHILFVQKVISPTIRHALMDYTPSQKSEANWPSLKPVDDRMLYSLVCCAFVIHHLYRSLAYVYQDCKGKALQIINTHFDREWSTQKSMTKIIMLFRLRSGGPIFSPSATLFWCFLAEHLFIRMSSGYMMLFVIVEACSESPAALLHHEGLWDMTN